MTEMTTSDCAIRIAMRCLDQADDARRQLREAGERIHNLQDLTNALGEELRRAEHTLRSMACCAVCGGAAPALRKHVLLDGPNWVDEPIEEERPVSLDHPPQATDPALTPGGAPVDWDAFK